MVQLNEEALREKLINMLGETSILAGVSPNIIADLADRAKLLTCKSGETLVRQGERGDTFFYILDGQVRVIDTEREPAQLLSYLHQKQFFGERALLFDEPRVATIDVVVDTNLAVFDRSTWHWLIENVPGLTQRFSELANRYLMHSQYSFPGRQLDEVVIRMDKRHILALIATLLGPLVLIILTLGIGLLLELLNISRTINVIVVTSLVLLGVGWIIFNYIDWINDDFIVTSKRIIHIERVLLYGESREEAPLTAIQDINISLPNAFAQIFSFYNIIIQTAGVGNIVFDGIRDANAIRNAIFEQRDRAIERVQASDTSSIRKSLVSRMGWQVGPIEASTLLATGSASQKQGLQLPRLVNYFVPRVREQQGNTITWRKHYLILWYYIWLPLFVSFGTFYLLIAALFGLLPFPEPAPSLALMAFVAWFGALLWYIYRYDTWRKDVYTVTDTLIIDIKGSPLNLGPEQRREGSFGVIQNTTYSTPTLFTRILNMGDVIIETAGTMATFTFHQVYDYKEVQQEVSRRLLAFKENERRKQRTNEERQYIRWLGEYHDLAQETGEVGMQKKGNP